MIILDTNVLSALMRKSPTLVWWRGWIASPPIRLDNQHYAVRGVSGLALLPSGRRRRTLEAAFARLLQEDLENRVLDFDSAAATEAASLAAARQKNGRPVDLRDTQIAGIALARRARLPPETSGIFGIKDFDSRSLGGSERVNVGLAASVGLISCVRRRTPVAQLCFFF